MTSARTALALLATLAFTGASASAAPPIGVPGVPPVNVPPLVAPPVNVPPVQAPNPSINVTANAQTSADVQNGGLTAINGTTVTVRLSNGKTQTYNVSSDTANELRASVGKPIAFRVQNGLLVVAGHEGNMPLQGTLTSLNGATALVRLANGAVQKYTVSAQEATQLKERVGKSIVFWTGANGSLQLDQNNHAQSRTSRKTH